MRIKYSQAIQESEEELMRLEQSFRGQKPADRVRVLRLLKSGAVKSLKDCAPLVGYSVTQLTRWWECYRAEGEASAAQAAQAGREGLADDCRGMGRLDASHASRPHRDHARGAQLPGARVGDPLQEWQVALVALQEAPGQVQDRAQAAQESPCRTAGRLENNFGSLVKQPRLKRVVALDEGRFGLITWLRRRWCPLGERPPWIVQDDYEWLWLYAAVEPTTGTGVFLLLPTVEGQCLELFLRHLCHKLGAGRIGVVLDSSGSGEVRWPQGMHPLYLPAPL